MRVGLVQQTANDASRRAACEHRISDEFHDAAVPAAASPATSDKQSVRFGFENTYARLPERFFVRQNPVPVAAPRLVKVNAQLACDLGLDATALESEEGVAILAGNRVAEGSEPLAEAYAGHQFGHFVPQLGDGRANLLGEVVGRDGLRYDIQLKESGGRLRAAEWTSGDRAGAARVPGERSDGSAGRAD